MHLRKTILGLNVLTISAGSTRSSVHLSVFYLPNKYIHTIYTSLKPDTVYSLHLDKATQFTGNKLMLSETRSAHINTHACTHTQIYTKVYQKHTNTINHSATCGFKQRRSHLLLTEKTHSAPSPPPFSTNIFTSLSETIKKCM